MKVSLIISFFNRIDYLRLILAALKNQSYKDFEAIIADDGSKAEVVSEIEKLSLSLPFMVKVVWHEDKGFRKNRILNDAIRASETDYLIFIDGDCIPHKDFIKEHVTNSEDYTCLTGRRVNLSKRITDRLNEKKISEYALENMTLELIEDGLLGKSDYVERGIYVTNPIIRDFLNKKERGLLGCNFSLHKKDMLAINGFDERYEAPSIGEDTDVELRLRRNGVKIKSLNNIAVQYHLYHKLQNRPQENLDLLEQVKKENTPFTPFGIDQV